MNDERWNDDAWSATYREQCAAPGAGCPPAEDLASLVVGESGQEGRLRIADHVVRCPACAQTMRDLMALHKHVESRGPALEGPRPARRRPTVWRLIGVAAGLVVAALAVDVAVRRVSRDSSAVLPPLTRSGAEGRIESRVGDVPLARSSIVLRWELTPPTAGARFDVTISDEYLEPLGSARGLTAAEFSVPAEWLARAPAGSTILWRVDAILADGTRWGSDTFTLRLE